MGRIAVMNSTWRLTSVRSAAAAAVCSAPWFAALLAMGALSGCGGADLMRAEGAKKYRPLPLGAVVRAAATVEELPQPVEVIGTLNLKVPSNSATPERGPATEQLLRVASGHGCDAVVGAEATTAEKISKKKVRELGPDGNPLFREEEKKSFEHLWTAKCVRTAEAPAEVSPGAKGTGTATAAAPPADAEGGKETAAEAKKRKAAERRAAERKADQAAAERKAAERKAAAEQRAADAAAEEQRRAAGQDQRGSEGAEGGGTATKPAEEKPAETKAAEGGVIAAPPTSAEETAVASEVARAFLSYSRAFAAGDHATICKMLDSERVYFDVRVDSPAWEYKADLNGEAGCQSLTGGELARYLRDLGPAEVHAEMSTLIPTLFGIHRGAFLKLDEAQETSYREKMAAIRAGKPALACQMYTVHAAGDLYKITLDCRGVKSYRLLLRRAAADDFKLMALTHAR